MLVLCSFHLILESIGNKLIRNVHQGEHRRSSLELPSGMTSLESGRSGIAATNGSKESCVCEQLCCACEGAGKTAAEELRRAGLSLTVVIPLLLLFLLVERGCGEWFAGGWKLPHVAPRFSRCHDF